jgi:hypothetical protein
MRFFSPAALGTGLGLTLLAAPLAMAQAPGYQHGHAVPHATMGHQMHMPIHRTVSMHRPMAVKPHMQPPHMPPHQVSMRHPSAMAPHHDMPHRND